MKLHALLVLLTLLPGAGFSQVPYRKYKAGDENTLTLRMRVHATPDLKTYAVEMPFLIKRSMHLELLK